MIGTPILSIAGSDPSGGAGIQADLKTIAACGGYGMSVITALTAQNTRGVRSVFVPPVSFLAEQLDAVLEDVPPGAIKIGMLGSAEVIDVVADRLRGLGANGALPFVVLDPVMVATSGDRLLEADAERAMGELLELCAVVTPNAPELAVLAGGEEARDVEGLVAQAATLAQRHRVYVLAKGGHLAAADGTVRDVLLAPDGERFDFAHPHVDTPNTHGTGCTLSSALATFLGRGLTVPEATKAAVDYLAEALSRADELPVGARSSDPADEGRHGPVNHLAELWDGRGVPTPAWAAGWWREFAELRSAALETTVVRAIASGAPDPALMHHYLGQDLAYLADYADRLDDLSAMLQGENTAQGRFWAASAHAAREEEPQLHLALGAEVPAPDAVTAAYADHLRACRDAGPWQLAAGLLPCFVLYAEVGVELGRRWDREDAEAAARGDAPPERDAAAIDWVNTYRDANFVASAAQAAAHVDELAGLANPTLREQMRAAAEGALTCEVAFFER